jgi:hypothetical protein
VARNTEQNDRRVLGFLGVGLDNKDEHKRITRSENFLLVGGSEETHESMQEIVIKFNKSLEQRGRRLQDTPVDIVVALFNEAAEK